MRSYRIGLEWRSKFARDGRTNENCGLRLSSRRVAKHSLGSGLPDQLSAVPSYELGKGQGNENARGNARRDRSTLRAVASLLVLARHRDGDRRVVRPTRHRVGPVGGRHWLPGGVCLSDCRTGAGLWMDAYAFTVGIEVERYDAIVFASERFGQQDRRWQLDWFRFGELRFHVVTVISADVGRAIVAAGQHKKEESSERRGGVKSMGPLHEERLIGSQADVKHVVRCVIPRSAKAKAIPDPAGQLAHAVDRAKATQAATVMEGGEIRAPLFLVDAKGTAQLGNYQVRGLCLCRRAVVRRGRAAARG